MASIIQSIRNRGTPSDTFIFVMGAVQSGKSKLIEALRAPRHSKLSSSGQIFIVETQGFESEKDADRVIFERLGKIFKEKSSQSGAVGVPTFHAVYCHPLAKPRLSGAAQRNFRAIFKLCLAFKTQSFVILTTQPQANVHSEQPIEPTKAYLQRDISLRGAIGAGAQLFHFAPGSKTFPDDFQNLLRGRIRHRENVPIPQNIPFDQWLGLIFDAASTKMLNNLASATAQSEEQNEAQALRVKVTKMEEQLVKTQRDHVALLSHLRIQDNHEMGNITRALLTLNHHIDDFTTSLSEYILEATPLGENLDRTSLDCSHPDELKSMFKHSDGQSSLFQSSTGQGMPIASFLESAISSFICDSIHSLVFKPFYPGIDAEADRILSSIYESLRRRDPQALSAKWRIDTVAMIAKEERIRNARAQVVADIESRLKTFLGYVYDTRPVDIQSQLDRLPKLIQPALDFSHLLKSAVVLLGDFATLRIRYGRPFDASRMDVLGAENLGSERKNAFMNTPVLATTGLGLYMTSAVGSGKEPESVLVSKAMVTTVYHYSDL